MSPVGGPPVWDDCLPSHAPDVDVGEIHGVLLGGGNIIHGRLAGVPEYRRDGLTAMLAYPFLWSDAAALASERGVPLIWNAPGVPTAVGPRMAGALAAAADGAAYLSVRDHGSRRRLEESGVRGRAAVVVDPAFEVARLWTEDELRTAAAATFQRVGAGRVDRWLAIHVNERYDGADPARTARLLDEAAATFDARVVLLGLGPCHGDDVRSQVVAGDMRSEPIVISRPASLLEAAALIRGATAYAGSSLHGFITACAYGVPGALVATEGISGGGKFSGFLEHVRLDGMLVPEWSEVGAALTRAAGSQSQSYEALASSLDRHWDAVRVALERPAPGASGRRVRRDELPASMVADAASQLLDEVKAAQRRSGVGASERQRAELEAARAEAEAARAEAELAHAEAEAVRTEEEAARAEAAAAHAQADRRLNELEAARAEAEAARAQADRRVHELGRELEEHRTTSEQLAELSRSLDALESGRDEARAAAEAAQRRAAAATAAIDDNRRTFQRRVKSLERRTAEAEQRAEEAEAALAEAGSRATEAQTAARDAAFDELLGHMVKLDRLATTLERSRAWRYGHGVMKLGKRLTFRRARGDGAPALIRRHASLAAEIAREATAPGSTGATPAGGGASRVRALDLELREAHAFRRDRLQEPGIPEVDDPPHDLLGRLVPVDAERHEPSVDVVVCVHDALEEVQACLRSLLRVTDERFGLIVVDDGSSPATAEYLTRFASLNDAVTLLRTTADRRGYTYAANSGLRAATGDYVVLLNSDTVVTRGWLTPILAAGEADPRLGLLGPLSNAASHQSVPTVKGADGWATNEPPAWATADALAVVLSRLSGNRVIGVPFLNGFCYVIRRRVLDVVGMLDEETFGEGFSEENDFSCRAAEAGFRLGVVSDSYVFHRKSRSYGAERRDALAKTQYRKFLDKHGERKIRRLVEDLDGNAQLAAVRERFERLLEGPRELLGALPDLRVTYVLPGLAEGGSGGSHSVVQEAHALRDLGIEARVVLPAEAMPRARDAYPSANGLLHGVRRLEDLGKGTEARDVLVATHWRSVAAVLEAASGRSRALPAYYVQDYEPLFEPVGSETAQAAAATYARMAEHLIFAKTDWLCDLVASRHGVPVQRVEPSIDRLVFHPYGRTEAPAARITAMVRPRTRRRAAAATLEVLSRLHERFGDEVTITTFGCAAEALDPLGGVPRWLRHEGVLARTAVGDLLRRSDLFLDLSWYQAFGRTALEAMACGATAAVPRAGGAATFAVDGRNALVVDTLDLAAVASAVSGLVTDADRRRAMQSAAVETGSGFSPERAAVAQFALFAGRWLQREGAAAGDRSALAVDGG